MAQKPAIGVQDFEKIRQRDIFYIDKTGFIREWWESEDEVTLITRPRRFGKTLNMSMLECFFSLKYENRGDLFEGLAIWDAKASDGEYGYRKLQGTYPVIALSFANIKGDSYEGIKEQMYHMISELYNDYDYLLESDRLNGAQKAKFRKIMEADGELDDATAKSSINTLTKYLYLHHQKKPLIFLDEYDTPMQEAWVCGYWDEIVNLIRNMFNSTFKTNPNLDRAVLTGITRVSKESIFSDLNNLAVVTTTSERYETDFGFTEQEVFNALDNNGLSGMKDDVKRWYDGFTFGKVTDIYNPWSIINFLSEKKLTTYWANTSSNSLVGKLIREGLPEIKTSMEDLIDGKTICAEIDEQIVFNRLDGNINAIWSLLIASGYLKVIDYTLANEYRKTSYTLMLTNFETKLMFESMIRDWFANRGVGYNEFIKAMLAGNLREMNAYMNKVALSTFSYFDTGNHPSENSEPERFYHGFVLGLMVDLRDRYQINSNRESGFGRYDIMLEPKDGHSELDAIVIEFKVIDTYDEKTLEDTVKAALAQIEEKQYDSGLISKGIPKEKIRHYGFAFEGKRVLIG